MLLFQCIQACQSCVIVLVFERIVGNRFPLFIDIGRVDKAVLIHICDQELGGGGFLSVIAVSVVIKHGCEFAFVRARFFHRFFISAEKSVSMIVDVSIACRHVKTEKVSAIQEAIKVLFIRVVAVFCLYSRSHRRGEHYLNKN